AALRNVFAYVSADVVLRRRSLNLITPKLAIPELMPEIPRCNRIEITIGSRDNPMRMDTTGFMELLTASPNDAAMGHTTPIAPVQPLVELENKPTPSFVRSHKMHSAQRMKTINTDTLTAVAINDRLSRRKCE